MRFCWGLPLAPRLSDCFRREAIRSPQPEHLAFQTSFLTAIQQQLYQGFSQCLLGLVPRSLLLPNQTFPHSSPNSCLEDLTEDTEHTGLVLEFGCPCIYHALLSLLCVAGTQTLQVAKSQFPLPVASARGRSIGRWWDHERRETQPSLPLPANSGATCGPSWPPAVPPSEASISTKGLHDCSGQSLVSLIPLLLVATEVTGMQPAVVAMSVYANL